ncbi:MAG: hypothetical protein CMJ18_04795 [Phycisphaeraceae bacterium]|nr:hypothetical protein [Phycisphaeraceae bacterium]
MDPPATNPHDEDNTLSESIAQTQNGSASTETITAASDGQAQNQVQLQIDDTDTPVAYSTTARVWGSAEEINLDFAGPIRPTGQNNVARLKIDQRITLNPWAAKRLAIALGQAITRYEQTYGTLEIDERKRRVDGTGGS